MIDVQTPWRDPPAELLGRHVGREDELHALRGAVSAWRAGGRPHPIYLWGPRGVGKSHLIALLLAELRQRDTEGTRLLHVAEDVPPAVSAADLLRRIHAADRGRFSRPPDITDPDPGPAVVVVEGLDVHLKNMGRQEQQRLRHAWQNGSWLLIATGCSLPDDLRSSDAPFYQAFAVWPLQGLDNDDAAALLDNLAGPSSLEDVAWPARRAVLARLSGGSPRALTTLGLACANHPDRWASEQLLTAVQQLSAHYQHRFRDLSPQQQRIVEAITLAPVEMTAPEIGAAAGVDGASTAKVCARLRDDGVLVARDGTSPTVWRVAEPMLRYWYEYRGSTWDESRVAVLGRLLESVLQPDEVIDLLLLPGDDVLRQAAQRATAGNTAALRHRVLGALAGDTAPVPVLLSAMDPDDRIVTVLETLHVPALAFALRRCPEALHQLPSWTAELVRGFHDQRPAKTRFFDLVRAVRDAPPVHRHLAALSVVNALLTQLDQRGARWQLGPGHRKALATTPFLRAWFLGRGKRPGDAPLLTPGDLQVANRPAFQEDWSAVAWSALHHRDGALLALVVAETPARAELVRHPRPASPQPGDADLFCAVLRSGGTLSTAHLLTWSAVLPDLPDDVAQAMIEAASTLPPHRWRDVRSDGLRAMLALAHRDVDRYERLRGALQTAAPWAQNLAAHADVLFELQTRPRPTHVEFQAVLDALRSPPTHQRRDA